MSDAVKVGLALSGGGVRGMAHIGVIKVLEKNQVPISFISGASAGALVGGIYASGTPIEKIEETVTKLRSRDIARLIDPGRPSVGFIKGNKLMKLISKILTEKNIENFKIPFSAIATDVVTGDEIIFNRGDALTAIRSSISFPGVFAPVKFENSFLVDGGVVNPLPVDAVKEMGADVILGVNVLGEPTAKVDEKKQTIVSRKVISNIISIMEKKMVDLKLEKVKDKNMVILKPNVRGISTFTVSSKSLVQAIKEGEKETSRRISEILGMIGRQ